VQKRRLSALTFETASEKCQQEKRKTVNGEDILFAMTSLGFENYGEALKIYLARYREVSFALRFVSRLVFFVVLDLLINPGNEEPRRSRRAEAGNRQQHWGCHHFAILRHFQPCGPQQSVGSDRRRPTRLQLSRRSHAR